MSMEMTLLDIYNESRLTYEALGELYSKKDKFRGNDFDIIDKAISSLNKKYIKVLDLGCGNGHFIEHVLKKYNRHIVEIVGVDFSKSMIKSTIGKLSSFKKNKTLMMCMV